MSWAWWAERDPCVEGNDAMCNFATQSSALGKRNHPRLALRSVGPAFPSRFNTGRPIWALPGLVSTRGSWFERDCSRLDHSDKAELLGVDVGWAHLDGYGKSNWLSCIVIEEGHTARVEAHQQFQIDGQALMCFNLQYIQTFPDILFYESQPKAKVVPCQRSEIRGSWGGSGWRGSTKSCN